MSRWTKKPEHGRSGGEWRSSGHSVALGRISVPPGRRTAVGPIRATRNNLPKHSICSRSRAANWAPSSSNKACSTPVHSLGRWQRNSVCQPSTCARFAPRPRHSRMSAKKWLASYASCRCELRDDTLDVAIADGSSAVVRDALSRLKVEHVNIYLAPPEDVLTCLNTYYRVLSDTDHNIKQFWDTAAARQEIESGDRRDRRGADHPIGQQDRDSGVARPRLRHPHRANRRSDPHPLSNRRCAPRGAEPSGYDRPRARQPHQDHGRHGHRRTTSSAGWSVRDDHRRFRRRCARRNRRDHLGRDRSASVARQEPVDEAPLRTRDARPRPTRGTSRSSASRTE